MELSLAEAEGRRSELVTAAQRGERVVITKNGDPAAELVHYRKRVGIDSTTRLAGGSESRTLRRRKRTR